MNKTRSFVAAISFLALASGCVTARPDGSAPDARPSPGPRVSSSDLPVGAAKAAAPSPREAAAFREIQVLFSNESYGPLLDKLEQFETQFPNSAQLSQVENYHGLTLLLTKRPLQAVHHFKKAVSLTTSKTHLQFMLYNLAAAQYDAGQFDDARDTIDDIDQGLLDNENRAKTQNLRAKVERKRGSSSESASLPPANVARVGVLLPMKGKFASVGARSLRAIQLAFRVFNTETPDSKVTLVIQDSGEDGDSAAAALSALVLKHRVVAVIGPLLSKGIDQVTQRAEDLGVPLISVAQRAGTGSENVFNAAVTPQMQAQQVAEYAINQLGLKRFAILHPQDRFGEEYSQSFWDSVSALGGSVTGIESYAPGETDFRAPIEKLVGLHYPEARQKELDELAKLREENKVTRRTRKTEQFYALKPIVDFDAVFVADEPKAVSLLLPTFRYKDVDSMQFLGPATWHSPELLARAGAVAEGAYLVDSFFAASESPVVRKFVEQYRTTFGQDPDSIDAIAFDAANVLEYALADSKPKSREDMREALKDIENFPGVTGKITYKDGRFVRDLKVIKIQGGRFVEAR